MSDNGDLQRSLNLFASYAFAPSFWRLEPQERAELLLYSFGLQDQEFVVVYETDDLPLFSELVYDLRGTEARRFTERDAPLQTAAYSRPEKLLKNWVAA